MSIHDKFGNYMKVCDNMELITGYTKSEIIGRSAYEFFNPKCIPDIVTSHLSPILTSISYQIVKKDGTFLYVNTLSFKTVDDGTKNDYICCVTKKMNFLERFLYRVSRYKRKLNSIITLKIRKARDQKNI